MDGPCWSGSAAGAVRGTAGPVTLRKLVGEGHGDAYWLPVGMKEEDSSLCAEGLDVASESERLSSAAAPSTA